MDWRNLPIVAFDTETTGLHAHAGDRVIEFAAVEFHLDESGAILGTKSHEMFFNPGIPIPREVVKLTGITDEDVADAPPFKKRAKEVHALLEGRLCIAHNLPFDRGFLSNEFQQVGLKWPLALAEIDTFDMSVRFFSGTRGHKLSDLSQRLGVTLDGAHRATNDAEASGRSFLELCQRMNAPAGVQEMLDWAHALAQPPENPWLGAKDGELVFLDGEHQGEAIEKHSAHLHWMLMALERREDRWHPRFPEPLKIWIQRFLEIRCSGRARQGAKSFGKNDWTLQSQALPPRTAN